MTPSKVIKRLVEFGPSVIAPHTKIASHCVLATRIGIDVLARFAVLAVPQAVRVQAINKIMRDALAVEQLGHDPDWQAIAIAGVYMIDTGGPGKGDVDPETKNWRGHLVISVPTLGCLVDLNTGAMSRPRKGIVMPPAVSMEFHAPESRYELPLGAQVVYGLDDDMQWQRARDWTDRDRLADIVDQLTRAIRKGRAA